MTSTSSDTAVLRVALLKALPKILDYLPPLQGNAQVGCRVRVPIGNRTAIGLIVGIATSSELEPHVLRHCETVLDPEPLFSADMMAFLNWTARYYHHPLGDVIATALPARLRQGEPAGIPPTQLWFTLATPADIQTLRHRAPRQAELLDRLAQYPAWKPFTAVDWSDT